MSSYLYAVVEADSRLPEGMRGIGDVPIHAVSHRGLAAVVGPVPEDAPLGRRGDVLAHSEVVEGLVRHGGTVIPVRFGAVFDDDSDVQDMLVAEHDQLVDVVDDLRGRSQFTLRARYDEEAVLTEVVGENPEIAELREATRGQPEHASYGDRVRLGELVADALESKRDSDGQLVLDALAPHAVAVSVLGGAGLDHLVRAAFLVEHDHVDGFEETAESVAAEMSARARVALVGPSAPYDFVAWGY